MIYIQVNNSQLHCRPVYKSYYILQLAQTHSKSSTSERPKGNQPQIKYKSEKNPISMTQVGGFNSEEAILATAPERQDHPIISHMENHITIQTP